MSENSVKLDEITKTAEWLRRVRGNPDELKKLEVLGGH